MAKTAEVTKNEELVQKTKEQAQVELEALLSTKAVSASSGGANSLAAAFEKIARENKGVVTFEQAKKLNPKSPSDCAYFFRQALGKCVTNRSRSGGTTWTVQAYPEDVKKKVEALRAQLKTA